MEKSTKNKIKELSNSWKKIVEELKNSPNYENLKKDIFKIYEALNDYSEILEEEDWL